MNRDSKQVLTEWLVLDAKTGSETAFRDLYRLWSADLRRLTQVRIERWDAANEVANDVWLDIARGLRHLDDPACFPRWAFCIVERRSADWIRRQSRIRSRERVMAERTCELAPVAFGAADPPDNIQALRLAVDRLPADQRQLIHLYYEMDRSVGEIAEGLSVPPGTVKSRLSSVRESLKRLLKLYSHE